ncbi:4-hydroxy-tetrahydrodipicolinate synthase [Vibrio sp. 10N.286.49.C2]|uniref:4-hydroxy-tetrahydrodipicolinate synthase n=1 Tax=unclassified Vibrio TaxID=2614977 RepID=UPI000C82DAED|nr:MULTISPECIES: 4-hydroxy-tetrahydrodipicolinate synthase [unclassified Vibrio]PMH42906.1 4-hydroxy-tetrahydrodipicolinate synthase [Vibrio sp. 10N.286.49.C2]PMH53755.1 4-hydroxy-tetrahydrodipicolinate synthase [Vibrio sp. 10N.286.49.B1]PMH77771.1 4-hydroxy-tetrahydrodipicolinate synthase [Vibrio sp. 10N.286.48.B7]
MFKGTFSVTVTPFSDDLKSVNVDALKQHTQWQVQQGIHGLIPLGSTGEFLSMTDEERLIVLDTVVNTVAGRVPVLAGTGAEDTREAVRLIKQAEDMGADGAMIIPPYYSSPTADELYQHYKTISDASSLPIMIYNNPATANVDLTPDIVARLSEIDSVSYIKESTMDVTRIRDIIELCGDRMSVFGGIMGYESFLEGAVGWVSVASNFLPGPTAKMFEMIDQNQDYLSAREIYLKYLPLIRFVGGHNYVSGSKHLLSLMGCDCGIPRAPRLPMAPELAALAEEMVQEFGLADSIR